MAEALGHRWGQLIGDAFELFVRNLLSEIATKHRLYLDFKKPRKARVNQGGKDLSKVTWQDSYGNKHDLDYVLELSGTEEKLGTPVAFIESAWRRYTKHSKNKAQEIEAAVMPVALTFARYQPFCGAVLAGEFTKNSLQQLRSKGFAILHIPYESILVAFAAIGIDASSKDGRGGTTEKEFAQKIRAWERLNQPSATNRLLAELRDLHTGEIADFVDQLEASINRRVTSVRLTVLRGTSVTCPDVPSAIRYLADDSNARRVREDEEDREHFEVQLKFNTGAKIEAIFPNRTEAIGFLKSFEQP